MLQSLSIEDDDWKLGSSIGSHCVPCCPKHAQGIVTRCVFTPQACRKGQSGVSTCSPHVVSYLSRDIPEIPELRLKIATTGGLAKCDWVILSRHLRVGSSR